MNTDEFHPLATRVLDALATKDDSIDLAFGTEIDTLADWSSPLESNVEALDALRLMALDDGFMSKLQATMHARLVEFFEARVKAG